MKVPTRVIGRISRKLESNLTIYADSCTPAHRKLREALRIIEDYLGRWFGAEDPVRFVKQAFRLEKFLVDDMDAIRAWFFLIMVGFSLLFALEGGREILRWIMRFAQAFPKDANFLYYRILRGFQRLLQSLRDPLTILVSRPRAP